MIGFAAVPTGQDYCILAVHLANAAECQMHPALWRRRKEVIARLRQMAEDPTREEYVAAYHSLRLLVW